MLFLGSSAQDYIVPEGKESSLGISRLLITHLWLLMLNKDWEVMQVPWNPHTCGLDIKERQINREQRLKPESRWHTGADHMHTIIML